MNNSRRQSFTFRHKTQDTNSSSGSQRSQSCQPVYMDFTANEIYDRCGRDHTNNRALENQRRRRKKRSTINNVSIRKNLQKIRNRKKKEKKDYWEKKWIEEEIKRLNEKKKELISQNEQKVKKKIDQFFFAFKGKKNQGFYGITDKSQWKEFLNFRQSRISKTTKPKRKMPGSKWNKKMKSELKTLHSKFRFRDNFNIREHLMTPKAVVKTKK